MRKHFWILFFSVFSVCAFGQMEINGQLLFGNEWIDYNKNYLKISLDNDGIYSLTYQDLLDNGIPIDQIKGSELQMFYFGEELPIYISSEDSWTQSDYLYFFGKKNDGELDKQLFKNWEDEQLNPSYSLYTDVSNYFLTWEAGSTNNARVESINNDLSGNLPSREEFYIHRVERIYNSTVWTPVAPEEPDSEYSSFIVTEGFGDKVGPVHSLEIPVSDIYINTSIKPRLKFRTGSNNQFNHIINILFNGVLLDVDPYSGNMIREYDYEVKLADLRTASVIQLEGKGISDNIIVSQAAIEYPRILLADNNSVFRFKIDSDNGDRYFEIPEFSGGNNNFVFDVRNNRIVNVVYENSTAKFLLPPSIDNAELYLINEDQSILSPIEMEITSFRNIDNLNPEYLIITSNLFNNDNPLNGINPIQAYADYRASIPGGSYSTEIIDVEGLYDHFAYGIYNHSYAIKNLAMYVKDKWSDFEMTFLIGKGLSYINRNRSTQFTSFVPSFGKPGSDNLLFAEGDFSYPYIGVGRLAAHTQEDVMNYLDKAKLHDQIFDINNNTIEERKWLKNILHLSGGDVNIQNSIFNHLQDMKEIIENNKFAANVTTFKKTSTDPVQTSLSQSIIDLIDEGTSIITFFGHSSAGTFDFSIEDPSKYNNTGRYPVVQSLGCHSGDIHETIFSLSEKFILTKDKGAIAFVASSGNAFIAPLGNYGKGMYTEAGEDLYGAPIGIILKEVLKNQYNGLNVRTVTFHQQNTLHGDPAVRLYEAPGPDYVVDFSTINTMGEVGTFDEHIDLTFDILNLGSGLKDSLNNFVVHEYGENKSDTIYFDSDAPFNRTTINLKLPNPGTEALGKNIINIVLDYKNNVVELPDPLGEDNNNLKSAYNIEGYCFFIFDNSAFPIFPRDFGIVYEQGVSLNASSNNAFGDKEMYLMELDTTELFDSPFLLQTEINSSPSLIQWTPNITYEHNTVYYWRISPKENNGQAKWNSSSFIFLEDGSDGWNQSHLYQWQKDDYNNYIYDDASRK